MTFREMLQNDAEVHVWQAALDSPMDEVERLYLLLSDQERVTADRFLLAVHRQRYVAAHAALRRLIGAYLREGPHAEPFVTGANGKPALSGPGPRFNLSHAGSVGLFAFALGREVGVDIEEMDPAIEVDSIARSFFSEPERSALQGLPAARRVEGFYHVWCQKEAYLKARGDGVAEGLDHFDVMADPDQPAALLADRRDSLATTRWRLLTLSASPGFRSALCVKSEADVVVRRLEWRSEAAR